MSQIGTHAGLHMQFSVAGKPVFKESRFTVNDRVFVSDGSACDSVDFARCFIASPHKDSRIRPLFVSRRIAAILILVVLFVTALTVTGRLKTKAQLTEELSVLNRSSENITANNAALALEITNARDETRICYIASRELGMISAEGVEIVYLWAPNTRPALNARQAALPGTDISSTAKN